MNTRKALSLMLALAMCLALFTVPAGAISPQITWLSEKYGQIYSFSEGLAEVRRGGPLDRVTGYIDKTGRVVIPLKYSDPPMSFGGGEYYGFCEGMALVYRDSGRGKIWHGYINAAGKEVVSLSYDDASTRFSEGRAYVERNDKYGYVDTTGREVIPLQYESARDFSEGLACVEKDKKYGYIDPSGKTVIPFAYDNASSFSEGLAWVWVREDKQAFFLDTSGSVKAVLPEGLTNLGSLREGMVKAKKDGKWGFLNGEGQVVVPFEYDSVGAFSEGLAWVKKDGKEGFIDRQGNVVVPLQYDAVYDFSCGLAYVKLDGKCGFVNAAGQTVVPLQYDKAGSYTEGLAWVNVGGKEGFIDTAGNVIVPPEYDSVYAFSDGAAWVVKGERQGIMTNPLTKVPVTLNGGVGPAALWSNASGKLSIPSNPVRRGYTFAGWYADMALTIPWNFDYPAYNGLELYAKWVPVSSTATTTAQSTQIITLNSNTVTLDAYTLKAPNGGDVTYVKLRDVAALLDGTAAQFNVDWRSGAIYVDTGKPYTTKNGTELKAITGADGSYKWNTAPVLFDGTTKALEGIVITDGTGGGHTFFKLRDLGAAIGFTVDWSPEKGIYIETE